MWNHRILCRDIAGCRFFAVHEVYYTDDGTPVSWTAVPVKLVSDSYAGLTATLEQVLDATQQHVLQEVGDKLVPYEAGD